MARSVLIVDDDPVIQLLLRVNFEMDGFRVTTADNGEAALAAAKEKSFDLVLLDVVMPGIDGYQVLEQLRLEQAYAGSPIVLLSAKTSDTDRETGLKAGATAYVAKPFDPVTLLEEMKGLLKAS